MVFPVQLRNGQRDFYPVDPDANRGILLMNFSRLGAGYAYFLPFFFPFSPYLVHSFPIQIKELGNCLLFFFPE